MGRISSGGSTPISSASAATAGDAEGTSSSGNKRFVFGANPNVSNASAALENIVSNPFVIIGALGIVWLVMRKRR